MREFLLALLVGMVITAGFEALSEFANQPDQLPAPPTQITVPADLEPGY